MHSCILKLMMIKFKKKISGSVVNNFRSVLFLGDFRKVFSLHRLPAPGEVLGKMVQYPRLDLPVRTYFLSLQLGAEGCTQITGIHLGTSSMHLFWTKVASSLYSIPGSFRGSVDLLLHICLAFLCMHLHIESQVSVLPTPFPAHLWELNFFGTSSQISSSHIYSLVFSGNFKFPKKNGTNPVFCPDSSRSQAAQFSVSLHL